MTILDRLLGRPEPQTPRTAKAVVASEPWNTGIPLSMYSDEPQVRIAAYLKAYKVGWFYKAGSKIADDVSTLDWSVSDGDAEEGEEESTLERPKLSVPFESLSPIEQFMRLLERPNPSYTGRQLLRKTQVRLDFAGAACWYLEGGTFGLPTAIYGVSPARMWPSYDKSGALIGWIMDKGSPSGGTPFDVSEILWFNTGNATDDEVWGTSVVEAVYAQVPLTDAMARHTADVLTTGGRLAGMMWPKERALSEDEFVDAQRAWRNTVSDPNSARRMLIFPEPMEYAAGASTPAEIGIPELANLNRDEILTAFPVSPYRLGVPMPGGLNSGETRREDRRDYWEETIHPRADLLEEFIQVKLLSRYEEKMGATFDFEIAEPNMDDAPSIMEKVAALRALASTGFDEKEAVKAVGLDHIKFTGIPEPDPAELTASVGDNDRRDNTQTQATVGAPKKPEPTKAEKARDDTVDRGKGLISAFLADQRDRVIARIVETLPKTKAARAAKVDPDWWDAAAEDQALYATLRTLYAEAGRSGLQIVADRLGRIVPGKSLDRVIADLNAYGTERISGMNAKTREALVQQLSEGVRRGYSVSQLVDGVPGEGFPGLKNGILENGVPAFSDIRAETIARTETALSYNRASLTGYKEFNVRLVEAIDGDGDEECRTRLGNNPWAVEEALEQADHPNGTLDWVPWGDKAWHPDHTADFLEAVKAIAERPAPDIHVHTTPPDVIHPAPIVNVEAQDIRPFVNAIDSLSSEVKALRDSPPVVNVPAPVVNVPPPIVNVKAPQVTDVRIVDDVSPPRVKRVIRGPKSRQYPAGPIEGIEE